MAIDQSKPGPNAGDEQPREPSPTAGMSLAQRILHVGGRNNAAGYVEFGSTQAVEALVRQVLRDLPAAPQPAASARERWNIERDGEALLVCFNDHEKGEKCRYERFVPEAHQPAQADLRFDWGDFQAIADTPEVDETIRALLENQDNDNAVCMVRAVIEEAGERLLRLIQPEAQLLWQPIKTAPKDGTHILVWTEASDTAYVVCWADAAKGIRRNLTAESGADRGWHLAWDGTLFDREYTPTHWMPLPDAPTAQADQGEDHV